MVHGKKIGKQQRGLRRLGERLVNCITRLQHRDGRKIHINSLISKWNNDKINVRVDFCI